MFFCRIASLSKKRLIPSAVDLKLIFFAESCKEGATSVHFINKEAHESAEGIVLYVHIPPIHICDVSTRKKVSRYGVIYYRVDAILYRV